MSTNTSASSTRSTIVPEQKCSSEGLGQIAMTRPVRISLGILRAYLVAMTLMLGYHVLDLAGVFHTLK